MKFSSNQGVVDPPGDKDDGNIARYFGTFSNESVGKANELLENINPPKKVDGLAKPRVKQQQNPHTSTGFFPSAN